jgi:hypothetical protein
MLGTVEMFSGVLVFGRIAAGDVPTIETHPQMHPSVARLYTVFANVLVGLAEFDLIEMRALISHS